MQKQTRDVILIGAGIGLLALIGKAKAEGEGNIVPSTPVIYGQCSGGQCLTGTEITAFVDFNNIGEKYIENTVGISVDGNVVKQISIGLNPGTGFTLSHTFVLDKSINVCGVVS